MKIWIFIFGWKMKTMPAKAMLTLLTSIFFSSLASMAIAEDQTEEEIPDIEFLEFLGSFETPNGKWLDPMEIENMFTDKMNETSLQEVNNNE